MCTNNLINQVRSLEDEVTRLAHELDRRDKQIATLEAEKAHARAHLIATREGIRANLPTVELLEIINKGLE